MWFLLIFLALPMIEIALFIQVGHWIGLWPTLLLVILAAVAGLTIVRVQGVNALARLQNGMDSGQDPTGPIAHGAMILVAGFLLILPGFFTDILGLTLLIPWVRSWLIGRGAARMTVKATSFRPGRRETMRPTPDVIDAEFDVIEEDKPKRPGNSGWVRPD